jgi:8-oxo-dGTP pyrophosphatase MutT (NUDIX family)
MGIVKTSGIFLINKQNQLLVAHPTRHAKNFWSIPKGKREIDEDGFSCAIRETWEEVNVDLRGEPINFHRLESQTFKNKIKKLKPYVVFERENHLDFTLFELKCNSNVMQQYGGFPEMDDFKWVEISEGYNILHPSQVACLGAIEEIIKNDIYREPLI